MDRALSAVRGLATDVLGSELRPTWLALIVIAATSTAVLVLRTLASLLRRARQQRQLPQKPLGASKAAPGAPWYAGSGRATLFGSREFVRDMARLAEHIVMNDVPVDFWSYIDSSRPLQAAAELQRALRCRECAPFFAPDRVGELKEAPEDKAADCKVRWQRAIWAVAFKQRYDPSVADWVDTAVGTEKPAAVLLLRPLPSDRALNGSSGSDQAPLIVVAFRGSKTAQDYFVTDASAMFVPVPSVGEKGIDPSRSRLMPFLAGADSAPSVTVGLWRAYAGEEGRAAFAPRARVRAAVERLLTTYPTARLLLTGHSLGGALATLCAYDLLQHSPAVRVACSIRPATLLAFAAPRLFNEGFRGAMSEMERAAALNAMRVVVGGDVVSRVPPRQLGGSHGVVARLLLHPDAKDATASFDVDDVDDGALWKIPPADDHVCHALYLGGETTPGRLNTVPLERSWPLPGSRTARKQ